MSGRGPAGRLEVHPLTAERWDDLERLFGPRGACGGCWCMWWRLKRGEFEAGKGDANRRAFRALVEAGREPGLLAYRDGEPIGWVAVEPREAYPALERSRTRKRLDEKPVWSVSCFFVARAARGQGVSVELLRAVLRHVAARGGRTVEGYPVEARSGRMPAAFAWNGLPSAFRRAGFEEVARPAPTRPIMRCEIRGRRG